MGQAKQNRDGVTPMTKTNYNRLSRRVVKLYVDACYRGENSITFTTRAKDYNAVALAINARIPRCKVYYECLSNKIMIVDK